MQDIGLVGSPLDRADALRADPAAIAALVVAPGSKLLRLDGLDPSVDAQGNLEWSPLVDRDPALPLALLGLRDGHAHFVQLAPLSPEAARSRPPFSVLDSLHATEASTYAAARSLVDWHARHPFCARCGQATAVLRAGWGRRCGACLSEHYPRTDAVVIMLAVHEGRVLVGRQPRFPPRRYSALAGFLEVGESLEEAVARELREEAGLRTKTVKYLGSQPWPFPSSLMLACLADVESDVLALDGAELEDAMWVTKSEVCAALREDDGSRFLAPPPYAIAHSLLRHFGES